MATRRMRGRSKVYENQAWYCDFWDIDGTGEGAVWVVKIGLLKGRVEVVGWEWCLNCIDGYDGEKKTAVRKFESLRGGFPDRLVG